MLTPGVVEVGSPAEALRHLDDDFLRWEFDGGAPCTGWVAERAAILVSTDRTPAGWLTGVGDPDGVGALLGLARESIPTTLRGLTVPLGLRDRLPGWLPVDHDRVGEWEWMRTYLTPPAQQAESRVRWLPGAEEEIADLLSIASPRHSAAPGAEDVRRWCGVRDDSAGGRLLACAAHTEHLPGVPHLASIATHPAARGRGYGSAVTAWVTRACFADGAPVVTLGMYSDNAAARSIYRRLGFAADHRFFSAAMRRP